MYDYVFVDDDVSGIVIDVLVGLSVRFVLGVGCSVVL